MGSKRQVEKKKLKNKNHIKGFGGRCAPEVSQDGLGGGVPGTFGTSQPILRITEKGG